VVEFSEILHYGDMKALKVRELSQEEVTALNRGLRSSDAFRVRRSQILLASKEGKTPRQIGRELRCSDQCVREAIHAFHAEGLSCLVAKSHATRKDQSVMDEAGSERLKEILHHSPRHYGRDSSLWILEGLAEVSYAEGITDRRVSTDTIRRALKKLGENWKRAKKRISSPDPKYEVKKGPESG
jgi:transposase